MSYPFARRFVPMLIFCLLGACGKQASVSSSSGGRPVLEQFDSDKDGSLSEREIESMNQEFFHHIDTDRDGKLSPSEREFVRKVGKVSVSTLTKQKLTIDSATAFISGIDRDGNGFISQVDVDERRWKAISKADVNGDGGVTADEWFHFLTK